MSCGEPFIYVCENCGKLHDGLYGSGRFCSKECSKGFSTKGKRSSINERISKKLTKEKIFKVCKNCQQIFEDVRRKKKQEFCSNSCSLKYKWKNEEYKEDMSKMSSKLATKRHLNKDNSFGWKSRNKIKPSYPESIAINFFVSNDINFIREFKEGKYFIDFILPDEKIAIEIDGGQHNKAERKKTDLEKDIHLKSKGWNIFRIKYPSENIKEELSKILNI